MWTRFPSSACRRPGFPAPFIEKTALSPLSGLDTLVKNHLAVSMRVYIWALSSVPVVCTSVFMPPPHCFDYCGFVISFEIVKCENLSFVLLQDRFDYSGSLETPHAFQIAFSISAKKKKMSL